MKSEQFKFGSEDAAIRGMREKERPEKKKNWDRIVYFSLLGIVVLVVLYYLITSFFIVSGQGRVLADRLTIRAPVDINIVDLYTESGDELQRGDSLFSYNYLIEESPVDSLIKKEERQAEIEGEQAEIEEDLFDLQEDIALKRQELQALQEKLEFYRQRKQRVEKEIKLNVETVNRLKNIEEEIFDIQADIEAVNKELGLLYQRRNRVRTVVDRITQAGRDAEEPVSPRPQIYRSPVEGKVANIFKAPLELALKSEQIISIQRDSARVVAKVLFDRHDARSLPIGIELNVRFDNGEPSRGVITDVYVAETAVGAVLNLRAIDSSEKIVVELKPLNDEIRRQWRSLTGMGVKASKSIF